MKKKKDTTEPFDKLPIKSSKNVIVNIKHVTDEELVDLPGYTQQDCEVTHCKSELCWNCCHSFKTTPVSYPVKYDSGIFYIYGYFCSYPCAARHILDTYKDKSVWEIYSLLNLFMNMNHKTKGDSVKPAPNRIVLSTFGGSMTIDEFRQSSQTSVYQVTMDPTIPIVPINHSHSKLIKTTNTDEVKHKYKLYRKKKLNQENNIYNTMNLITDST